MAHNIPFTSPYGGNNVVPGVASSAGRTPINYGAIAQTALSAYNPQPDIGDLSKKKNFNAEIARQQELFKAQGGEADLIDALQRSSYRANLRAGTGLYNDETSKKLLASAQDPASFGLQKDPITGKLSLANFDPNDPRFRAFMPENAKGKWGKIAKGLAIAGLGVGTVATFGGLAPVLAGALAAGGAAASAGSRYAGARQANTKAAVTQRNTDRLKLLLETLQGGTGNRIEQQLRRSYRAGNLAGAGTSSQEVINALRDPGQLNLYDYGGYQYRPTLYGQGG